jgi:hypothetical protein
MAQLPQEPVRSPRDRINGLVPKFEAFLPGHFMTGKASGRRLSRRSFRPPGADDRNGRRLAARPWL